MDYRPERPQPPSYEEFWRKKYEREKAGKVKLKCVLVWLISLLIAAVVIAAIIVVLWVFVFKKKDDDQSSDGVATLPPGNQSISVSTSTTPFFSTTTLPPSYVLVNSTVELIGVTVSNVSTVTPASEDNSFFILDTASNTAILYNEGAIEQIHIYFSKQQQLGCTMCRLHTLQRRAAQQTYYDTDAIYCCSECAQSSTEFCNYYGTTISQALSPFLISMDIPTGSTNPQNLTILTKTNSHTEPPTITATQYLRGVDAQNTSWSPVIWYAWLDTGYYAQTVVKIGRTENDTCRMSINAPVSSTSTSLFLARKDVHDLSDNDALRMVIFDKDAKIANFYRVPCGPEPQVCSINFGNRTVLDLYVNPDGQLYTLETGAEQVWVQRFELVQDK